MKTIEVIDAPSINKDPSVEVKVDSSAENEKAEAANRRRVAEKVFGKIVHNLSDEDLKKYEAAGVDLSAELDKAPVIGAPEGFPESKELEEERDELGPVGLSLRQRAKAVLGLPNLYIAKGSLWAHDKTFAKREAFQAMSSEEQAKERKKAERYGKIAVWGAAALAVAGGVTRYWLTKDVSSGAGNVYHTSHGGIQTAKNEVALTVDNSGGGGKEAHNASSQSTVRSSVESEQQFDNPSWLGEKYLENFKYNPAIDPALNPHKHGNDFGIALQETPADKAANLPGGTMDLLMGRWQDSPEEFATVMSKLGMVINDAASINQLAEQMKADPKIYMDNYDKVLTLLEQSKHTIRLETIDAPYGSYYAVNNGNGDATIAYDNYVNHGGTMIVIDTPQGKLCFRRECGGQPIDLLPKQPAAPAPQHQPSYQPRGGGSQNFRSNPNIPVNPETPSTPTTPDTPDTPPVTPPPVNPPPVTPPAGKGNAYPEHPNLTNDLGPGEFMPTPVPVETTIDTTTGRDIGGGNTEEAVRDAVTNNQGTQTGGRSNEAGVTHGPGQDTSSNPNSGNGVGAGDTSGNSNSSDPGSR